MMAKTIVGVFESRADAERAATLLEGNGIDRRSIHLIDAATAREREERWMGESESGGFWSWLFGDVRDEGGREFPSEDSEYYRGRMTGDSTLVTVTTHDTEVARVGQLLER